MCYMPKRAARSGYLPLRVAPSLLAWIDAQRGTWSRSEYVRQALALAHRHNLTGPKDPT